MGKGLGVLAVLGLVAVAGGIAIVKLTGCGPNAHDEMGCVCNDGYHPVWYDYNDGKGIITRCESDSIPNVCRSGFYRGEDQVCRPL